MDRQLIKDAGFTLIELMVVVAILALLATTATLSAVRPGGVQSDAARFLAAVERQRAKAVLSRKFTGISVDGDGFAAVASSAGGWVEVGQGTDWRGSVSGVLPERIVFTPSGQMTPLRLTLSHRGRNVICETDGWAELQCRGG